MTFPSDHGSSEEEPGAGDPDEPGGDEMTTAQLPHRLVQPAAHLLGETLDGSWQVVQRFDKGRYDTGGTFSSAYLVEKDGTPAFLKALDLSVAFGTADTTATLQRLTTAYEFEKSLVMSFGRMNRVVQAIDSGEFRFQEAIIPVPYLIFEHAEAGDARRFVRTASSFDDAWALRSLHHIAVGLSQLHGSDIAHQDLKPSNVMVFGDDGQDGSKIGDFGRASRSDTTGPADRLPVPGDHGYACPEHLYRQISPDWRERRVAADLYHLGSMAAFFFLGQGMTSLVESQLSPAHHWSSWGGTYSEVVPFLRDALDEVLVMFDEEVPLTLPHGGTEAELTALVRYLCDPEPLRRGHPRNNDPENRRAASMYSLQRFISRFNHMAKILELNLGRAQ